MSALPRYDDYPESAGVESSEGSTNPLVLHVVVTPDQMTIAKTESDGMSEAPELAHDNIELHEFDRIAEINAQGNPNRAVGWAACRSNQAED